MNKWDERYASEEFFYGKQANVFFADYLTSVESPGKILLPAEGEGRNAIFAARQGWEVEAFDSSKVAMQKALDFASKNHVEIKYNVEDLDEFVPQIEKYDLIALIFVHMPEELRKTFHEKMVKSLKKGGIILVESFAKEQINNNTGGPNMIQMLHSAEVLKQDFEELKILKLCQEKITLDEGRHKGDADVIRFIGEKS